MTVNVKRTWLVQLSRFVVIALLSVSSARHASAQSSGSFPDPTPVAPPPAAPVAPAPYAPAPAPPMPAPAEPATPMAPAPAADARALAPPAVASESAPPLLPYRKGLPIPPGYTVVHRSNSGLVIGGLLTLLTSYGAGIALAAGEGFENGTGYMAIPVVGPWVAISGRKFKCTARIQATVEAAQRSLNSCVSRAFDEVTTIVFITIDGLLQATGAALFFVGLGSGHDELVRDDLRAAVLPLPEGGAALRVQGHF